MPSVIQPTEFFVVGGPVQPERPCYIEREADRQLQDALAAKRWCCVLGAVGIGKTSLLQRAARTLRASGTLVASIDLRSVAEQRDETVGSSLLPIAERIAAELHLGVDVGSWWHARDAADAERLVEFFWKIVLTNTTAPIVVLLDDVDSVLGLPAAAELLDAIGACYARRKREPDFARLGFALAGCASSRELESAAPDSGVAGAELIEPSDFTSEQAYRLAVPFGGDRELAQAMLDRICAWTGGHPYLTQRVARGVARKGGRLEDVERVVREQFLTPDGASRDALLAHLRAWLAAPSRAARLASALLRKLAAGRAVAQPADAAVADRLWLSGTVALEGERLRIRNRIFKELVATGWLKKKGSATKWLAVAAVLLVAIVAGGYWYTQQLPLADVATLTDPRAAPSDAEEAYLRLRGLPGFEQRAEQLWLAALRRESGAASTLAEALLADARLRELPDQEAAADRLLAEFWLRRARERAHLEQREAAILLAQRAAILPAADPSAGAYLAELVGDDYSRIERTLSLASAPEYWHASFARDALVALDAQQRAVRISLEGASADPSAEPVRLSALAHSPLTRELAVDGEGAAGELELSLAVQHAAAGELLVTLTAPSGASAVVNVPRSDGVAVETFSMQGGPGSPLAPLADEAVRGVWRLTVVDREPGNTGIFGGWGLRFGELVARDDPAEPVALEDPARTEDVVVRTAAELAVAWPATPGAAGTLAVWNLATGRLEHDFTLPEAPRYVAVDPAGARVLAATQRAFLLWNVADGALIARVGTETEFVLPPVFSADGGSIAIAERVDGANPLYSVLRSADGALLSTIDGVAAAQYWELGPGGRYVALRGPETIVRVLETRRGAELRRLPHADAVERLLHSDDGAMLVTVDRAGTIASWPLALASSELGRPLGHTASAASVSASADGRRLAFTRDDGAVQVLDVVAGVELYRLRLARSLPVTATQLSADGTQLVTLSGASLKSWRLPARPLLPRTADVEAQPTALALERAHDVVAVGLTSGQLQLVPAGSATSTRSPLSFFGHRGGISAVALNGTRGLAATGGRDGLVRLWDLASGDPTGAIAQPAGEPVTLVAMSSDGRYVASAAGRSVRAAAVADGRVLTGVEAQAGVTALAFAPDAAVLAVGDATGAVVIVPLEMQARDRVTVRLGAAATSLAFAPGGGALAAADAGGGVTLVATGDGDIAGLVRHWSQPIRWLEFSPDGSALLVATDAWLHALMATPALVPVHSKLVVWPASSTAFAAVSSSALRFAGAETGGVLVSGVVDIAAPSAAAADASALAARDWSRALAWALNDNGDPVSLGP